MQQAMSAFVMSTLIDERTTEETRREVSVVFVSVQRLSDLLRSSGKGSLSSSGSAHLLHDLQTHNTSYTCSMPG